jgi:hypothetical protein
MVDKSTGMMKVSRKLLLDPESPDLLIPEVPLPVFGQVRKRKGEGNGKEKEKE